VAIVVVDIQGEPGVPIFQRTADMSRHAGQMALPGGRLHQGETAEACALRELDEELGLKSAPDRVIGSLDDFDTRSGFTITPVVVWGGADAGLLAPSAAEVARLFLIPLPALQAAARAAEPGAPGSFSLKFPSVEVFAPTAAMLYQFSMVALDGRTVRVADFYQPPWTHR
jgi:8-oxo-dGTP pyrophosphatase MutT (NUDIX family)